MSATAAVATMRAMRTLIDKRTADLDESVLRAVAPGFRSNLAWTIGHLAVTPYLLIHGRGSVEAPIAADMIETFKKGTVPADGSDGYAISDLRSAMHDAVDAVESAAASISAYEYYETSAGVPLASAAEALAFLAVHDGIHLGYTLALTRALAAAA